MLLTETMMINQEGILTIGGVNVVKLMQDFGSPLLVYDETEIRQNIAKFKKAVKTYPGGADIIYASKAFLATAMARIVADSGLSLDVVSAGELGRAIAGRFPPEKIYMHGNNKSRLELKQALQQGVGTIIVDNDDEAELLSALAAEADVVVDCIVRTTPGISAHTHEFIRTGQADSKFGVSIKTGQALELILRIEADENLNFRGIHAHIGSQIYDVSAFRELIWVLLKFMIELRQQEEILVEKLNLGGGFGVPEKSCDPKVDIASLVQEIGEELVATCERESYPLPRLLLEPGRSIVGSAGTSLYTVGSIKEIAGIKTYVAVDGGMADNIRPALYGAEYEAFLANRSEDAADTKVTIAGKCCESGDILIEDAMLPHPERGDILAIPATGAYTYALSSNYNGLTRPAVVLVNQGASHLIIARETTADLYRHDRVPPGY
ncbi:MAG: diaminopimelate decarboxylase [Bacillota bacterium]